MRVIVSNLVHPQCHPGIRSHISRTDHTQHQAININQAVNSHNTTQLQGLAQNILQDKTERNSAEFYWMLTEFHTSRKLGLKVEKIWLFLLLAPLPFQGSFTSRLTVADIGNFLPKHRHMNISITSRQKHVLV